MPLARATARVVLGVDSSSLLPSTPNREFEVETPERNLIAKTLEGQDATVSCPHHVIAEQSRATIYTILGHDLITIDTQHSCALPADAADSPAPSDPRVRLWMCLLCMLCSCG